MSKESFADKIKPQAAKKKKVLVYLDSDAAMKLKIYVARHQTTQSAIVEKLVKELVATESKIA